jgi:hypothetical protein
MAPRLKLLSIVQPSGGLLPLMTFFILPLALHGRLARSREILLPLMTFFILPLALHGRLARSREIFGLVEPFDEPVALSACLLVALLLLLLLLHEAEELSVRGHEHGLVALLLLLEGRLLLLLKLHSRLLLPEGVLLLLRLLLQRLHDELMLPRRSLGLLLLQPPAG